MQKKIIKIFLDLVTEKGWQATTLESVSEACDLPISELTQILPSKERLFPMLAEIVEQDIFSLLGAGELSQYSEKERAIEIFLTKFEILTPFKLFFKTLRENFLSETEMSIPFSLAELSSLDRILTHYQFSDSSLISTLKRKGLFGIYLLSLDTWLKDETEDLSPTLAKLDSLLSKGESLLEKYS
jgi:ubiquinone biosynthesis protein COQ9